MSAISGTPTVGPGGVPQTAAEPRGTLGLGPATALIVGTIIGVGIFNLPSSLAAYGPMSLVAMALTTVGALALALMFAALSKRLPADGGPYAYACAAFGNGTPFRCKGWRRDEQPVQAPVGRPDRRHPDAAGDRDRPGGAGPAVPAGR